MEVFFHNSMQYDHTLMRWEHEWAGTEACGSHDVTVPIQIEVRMRPFCEPFADPVALYVVSQLKM